MTEKYTNFGSAHLAGDITSGATTITVDDASKLPSTGNFRLTCDQEVMLCTAVSGNNLTVTRGYESTLAAGHVSGAVIANTITAGSIRQIITDNGSFTAAAASKGTASIGGRIFFSSDNNGGVIPFDNGSSWQYYVGLYGPYTPPLSDFATWVNQGSRGTITVMDPGYVYLGDSGPSVGSENLICRVKSVPGSTWTMTLIFSPLFTPAGNGNMGICLRESSSSKIKGYAVANSQNLNVWNWANATTFAGSVRNDFWYTRRDLVGLQVVKDATNFTYNCSCDGGRTWQTWFQETVAGNYLSGADQVGFYVNNLTGGTGLSNNWLAQMAVYHAVVA